MRIGLISYNTHSVDLNFASPLHLYAFQQYLLSHGIDSTVIDYIPLEYQPHDVCHPLFDYTLNPKKKNREDGLQRWTKLFFEREKRFQRIQEFAGRYYAKTSDSYTLETLPKIAQDFDCLICVSDVLWKYYPGVGFDKGFLLACDAFSGKKKISYAVGRGGSKYTLEREQEFYKYISDFDMISVRENSFKVAIEKRTKLNIPRVLDPVFLQPKEFYENMAILPRQKGYLLLLLYIVVDKSIDLTIKAIHFALNHNLKIIDLSEFAETEELFRDVEYERIYDIGVEDWLGYMLNADCIFTNSFHGCCFSILFHKQFFVGERPSDKVDQVLEMFALSGRSIKNMTDNQIAEMPELSFSGPDALLDEFRAESTSYILNAIRSLEQRPHQPILPQIDRILSDIDAELAEREKHNQKRSLARQIKTYIKKPIKALLRRIDHFLQRYVS